ncbi:S-adenosyl-L-methionine-dependent methyltransferase [Geopyxis carbonaria]|nr:S-adenosyl-L-methionine-dependent methyltransferase [Geopyxis carbonaria]
MASTDMDNIEVDSSSSSADSTYSSKHGAVSTCALAASQRDLNTYENGRRYHGFRDGRYMLPNDDSEQERIDLHHHCLTWHFGGELHLAPLRNPRRILDIGAGSGLWCISIAEEFPEAEVVGIDLSVIDPPWTPPNVLFVVEDAEDPWTCPPGHFDYIHLSSMTGCIQSWPQLLRQATAALAPGGFLELVDHTAYFLSDDNTTHPSHYTQRWIRAHAAAFARQGIPWLEATREWERWFAAAGYVDVASTARKAPVGTWPKKRELKMVGRWWRKMFSDGLEGLSLRPLVTVLGWGKDETRVFLDGVRAELEDPGIHAYGRIMAMWGRRPFPGEVGGGDAEMETDEVTQGMAGIQTGETAASC